MHESDPEQAPTQEIKEMTERQLADAEARVANLKQRRTELEKHIDDTKQRLSGFDSGDRRRDTLRGIAAGDLPVSALIDLQREEAALRATVRDLPEVLGVLEKLRASALGALHALRAEAERPAREAEEARARERLAQLVETKEHGRHLGSSAIVDTLIEERIDVPEWWVRQELKRMSPWHRAARGR